MLLKNALSFVIIFLSVNCFSTEFSDLRQRADKLIQNAESSMLAKHGIRDRVMPGDRSGLYLAISESIPQSRLSSIIRKTAAIAKSLDKPISVVFLGINKDDKTIIEFMRRQSWLFSIIDDHEMLNLTIDPVPFKKAKVTQVPAAIFIEDNIAMKSTGYLAFRDLLESKAVIDSGNTYDVVEVDLMELMKSKIDVEAMEKQATKNHKSYWERHVFTDLPTGIDVVVRDFNPEVVVVNDILDKNGYVAARAGARINPMKALPFNRVLITFNPEDKRQMLFALEQRSRALSNYKVPVLLATKFKSDRGWEFFSEMEEYFGTTRIFLLQESIVNRFNLKTSPSIVEAHPTMKYMLKISEASCFTQECML